MSYSMLTMSELFESKNIELLLKDHEDKFIERPTNTYIPLFKSDSFCFIYKTPFPSKNKKGVIQWVQVDEESDCQAFKKLQVIESLEGIEKLKFSINQKDKQLFLDISFSHNTTLITKSFPLLNNSKVKRKKINFYYPSITKELIGSSEDNYKDKTSKLCHKVDRDCKNIISNKCDLCRYGYFEVIDHYCPQGGSKHCGVSHCGEKGQPACLVGFEMVNDKFKQKPCQELNPAGYCLPGLNTFCDQNNVLICL